MAAIIEAASESTVSFLHQSKQKFYVYLESNFLVMPDGKTIVGRDASNPKKLFLEDITTNAVRQIGTLTSFICTILYDPKSQSLFAGDGNGHLNQYQKTGDAYSFFVVKYYGDIGLGELRSSALVGDVAIFGGSDSCLAAVNIPKKELLSGQFKTAFRHIYSLQACEISRSSTLLSVGGEHPSYSNSATDIFEIKTGEESPAPSISSKTDTSELFPALVKDSQYSEKMVKTLLTDIFAYLDVLFRNFTRHYEARLKQTRGIYMLYLSNPSRIPQKRSSRRLRTLRKAPENYRRL